MEILRGSAKFRFGISDPEQLVEILSSNKPIIGLAFIGRSNVGKSSLINSLFGNKVAKTSKTPGRTREVNIFEFKLSHKGKEVEDLPPFYLFDLPGYGFAEVGKQMKEHWKILMGTFFEKVPMSVAMVNLQDARHPHMKADQEFQNYLEPFGFHTFLAFNKMDKLKKQKERAALNKLKPQIFKEYKWVKQINFISAEDKNGLPELETALISYLIHQENLTNHPNS